MHIENISKYFHIEFEDSHARSLVVNELNVESKEPAGRTSRSFGRFSVPTRHRRSGICTAVDAGSVGTANMKVRRLKQVLFATA